MYKVSVIIVSWNVSELIEKCIKSLLKTKYESLEIIVVDNNSSDNSVELLEKYNKDIILLLNNSNIGFPRAVNQAIKKSSGELIIMLNPDTIVDQDIFIKINSFFRDHVDAGAMGPKFLNPDGSTQGSVFPEPSILRFIGQFWLNKGPLTEKYTPITSTPIKVNSISGGCLIFPRSILDLVGYLTEEVFMYYEDLDFCRRIRSAGLAIYFNPEISIIHLHGQSSKKSGKSIEYLKKASVWYNGIVKYFILWLISWSGQKMFQRSR